ncbi:DUF2933 domain-containing protein [Streptomyces caniferus]|uniref:hypothetical protein n=1 Tax=Streptomyces caniferus TaxID=285557 RepID=UPI002E2C69D5|nr:hypothetical protein [Streptomyces caniferus]
MCLNKKVLAGVAAGVLVLLAVRPAWMGAALPLLIAAVCPLSMLAMMRRRPDGAACRARPASKEAADGAGARSAELDERIRRLRAEVQELGSSR